MAAEEAAPEPWTQLAGLAEVLEIMEAAVSQNIYLPQLMMYRWTGGQRVGGQGRVHVKHVTQGETSECSDSKVLLYMYRPDIDSCS